ncbi:MAG: peptidase M14, partial [Proteobacteria bacterium]|nr:peptidase M14 [Pseudomonadota bacterium]
FLGYEYKRKPSEVSGQLMTVYDPTHPEIWKIPLQKEFIPDVKLKAPIAGYIIPPAYRKFIEPKLRAHKINFTRLDSEQSLQAEVYRVQTVKLAAGSYEKHQRADYKGEWVSLQETIARNSLFLPIDQPGAVLLMQLFEPESTDSLLAWGYFNEIFERKEYMEPYVAEALALELLKEPALRQEFESKLAHDQEFAKNPQARLDFFYRRHTSFDQRYFRYPVLRLAQAPLKPSS